MAASIVICVFAKPPVPGRAKTRLAAKVGDARAAAFAGAFLFDTWTIVSSLPWAKAILATTEGAAPDFGLSCEPVVWLQGSGDLGSRLERIMRRGLCEADLVIAIGADSPGLPARLLVDARDRLASADAVLGPSEDGGFYLIGLRCCPRGLFDRLPWSAPTTFAATQARLQAHGLRVQTLEPWFDVDRPADLERLRAALEHGEISAPATRRVLALASPGEVPCP